MVRDERSGLYAINDFCTLYSARRSVVEFPAMAPITVVRIFFLIFGAVYLIMMFAGGVLWFERGWASAKKRAFAGPRQSLFKAAIDNETFDHVHHHSQDDPNGTVYQKRLDRINKAEAAGDWSPPKLPDYTTLTLKQSVTLPDGSTTLAAGTKVEFVADQPNSYIQVRYSGQDMIIPASVVEVE